MRAIELSADSTVDTEKQAMRVNVDHNLDEEGQNKHAEDTTERLYMFHKLFFVGQLFRDTKVSNIVLFLLVLESL